MAKESPNFKVDRPGKPAMELMGEALDRQIDADGCCYYHDHPGQMVSCFAKVRYPMSPITDYEDVARGNEMLFFPGGYFEAGQAFISNKELNEKKEE